MPRLKETTRVHFSHKLRNDGDTTRDDRHLSRKHVLWLIQLFAIRSSLVANRYEPICIRWNKRCTFIGEHIVKYFCSWKKHLDTSFIRCSIKVAKESRDRGKYNAIWLTREKNSLDYDETDRKRKSRKQRKS